MTLDNEKQTNCAAIRRLLPNSPLDQVLRLLAKAVARRLLVETRGTETDPEPEQKTLRIETD